MTTLQANQLTLSRGKRTLCRDLSFTIQRGDFTGILGPNGSGKSTLLLTLAGHLAPEQGHVLLNQQPLSSLSSREVARQIGILFQNGQYSFPQSVRDFCLAARFPHQSVIHPEHTAAQDIQITTQALIAAELSTLAENNIQHLSGGEQRRAALAALLVQSPDFLLLDEPVNHLDLRHQIQMMRLLRSLTNEHAVVMSLHDINLAQRFCSKIILMFDDGNTLQGETAAVLTPDNLSRLYHHPIDAAYMDGQPYWLPQN